MTRKSIRKFLPLTYQPKIPGVQDGSITQSIRIDTRLDVGDLIAFHGWEGRPYHSPWSFRTDYFRIRLAKPIHIHDDRVYLPGSKRTILIGDPLLDRLAEKDGIEPATGEELLRVLHAMHGSEILYGKVLRWELIPENKVFCVSRGSALVSLSSIMPFEFFEDPVDRESIKSEGPSFVASPFLQVAKPAINQRIFEKIRQAERDLKPFEVQGAQ